MKQKSVNILNNEEYELVSDPRYPILKKGAMDKIKAQLHALGSQLIDRFPGHGYKISAGENYRDLPYMVLDFPKISGPGFPFLFRTMWWWGKPVCFQFFLKRETSHVPFLDPALADGKTKILVGDDLWENDFLSPQFETYLGTNPQIPNSDYIKWVRQSENKKPENLFEEASGFYECFQRFLSTPK